MKTIKQGRRHSLLLYKRSLDRLWMPIFPIGLLIGGWIWFSGKYWEGIGYIPSVPSPYDLLLYVALFASFAFTLFAWVARNLAYVQAKSDHLRIVTPFLAVKVSYRRVQRVHPAKLIQLFPPDKTRGSLSSLLSPYYGSTAIAVETKGYPLSPVLLRLFLGRQMFLPTTQGFVLLVSDWMALTTEIDSLQGAWRQKQNRPRQAAHPSMGLLKNLNKKR